MSSRSVSVSRSGQVNGIKEYRNYLWMTDKDGKIINKPEGGNDHFLDAVRYAVETMTINTHLHSFKPAEMLQRKYSNA
jgi:phage terminase large subunit